MTRRASDAASAAGTLDNVGKGVPLSAVPAAWPLYIVEFKAGRTDLFYITDLGLDIRVGDLVVVEADRGRDLGTVVNDTITLAEVEAFQRQQAARAGWGSEGGGAPPAQASKEINPKMIYSKANAADAQSLLLKIQDEEKALQLCQNKVRQKKLPMEVVDAEYQWDRRKLTFYFVAEKRIDFRELVRELFRLYKTRIWMASLQGANYDQ
jgi:cell fate regulator YaaT (PSP1 superfamily)